MFFEVDGESELATPRTRSFDVGVNTRFRLVDMFDLSNKSQWFFSTRSFLRKGGSLGICCESMEVVTALFLIRGTTLRMKPDTVFQNLVPDVASPQPSQVANRCRQD